MSGPIEELRDNKLESFVGSVERSEETFDYVSLVEIVIFEMFGPLDTYRFILMEMTTIYS